MFRLHRKVMSLIRSDASIAMGPFTYTQAAERSLISGTTLPTLAVTTPRIQNR
jgi:hypothetical protein